LDPIHLLLLAGIAGLPLSAAIDGKSSGPTEDEARIFLDMFEAGFKKFNTGMSEEYWNFYTRGDPGRTETYERIQSEILGDAGMFHRLSDWRGRMAEPLLARRVELLYRIFALARVTSREEIYTLENSLRKIQINFRSLYRGNPATQNQLGNVMRFEKDRALRKEAWLARNQAGKEIAPELSELIRRRNEAAKKLGHSSFYSMSLALSDIDEAWLFETLEDLDRLSRAPYRDWRDNLRRRMEVPELEAWDLQFDYDDFQGKLRAYFPREKVLERLKRTFRGLGLDIEAMPIRLDDQERPGKSQHAFCFFIDVPDDIRVLTNADDGVQSYRTLFHEMGHAVYSAGIRQESHLLQDAASACFTEGIGQFFPLLLQEEAWLTRTAELPVEMAREFRKRVSEEAPFGVRASLAVLRFEREAYRNPDQDLTGLWWSLTEESLGIPRHPEVDSWAAIIHFTSHPAYYQNYLLADMIAAQLMHRLRSAQGPVLDNPATGEFFQTRIFAPGASLPWTRLLADATGEPLNVRYFLEEKLGAPAPRDKEGGQEKG
jgi:peptidyl-dipeptidase A